MQVDTRGILNAFFRHSRLFLLFFAPPVLIAIFYLSMATPAYESTAKLLVKFGPDARPEIASVRNTGDGMASADEHRELVQSNVKILTSRDLAEKLLGEVTLARAYPQIAAKKPHHGTPMDIAVKRLSDDLIVKTDNDSAAITVGLFNPDATIAADMLQQLIDLFIARQSEIYSNPQTAILREQADEAYRKLQDATGRLNQYKAQSGVASVDQELNLLIQQRADISGYMSRRAENGAASATAAPQPQGQAAMNMLPARFPTASGDRFPTLDDVQRKIDDLRSREAELLQTYRPDSDVIINLRKDIAAEEAGQKGSVDELGQQIADLDRQIVEKDKNKAIYEEMSREVEWDEETYKAGEMRAQEAEAGQDLNQRKITQISIIEQPTIAYKPSRPRTALIFAFALLIGLSFGLAACLIAENFSPSFSLPEQASAELGVPILASFAYAFPQKKKS